MSRARYFLRRTFQTFVMIWLAITFLFFFFRLMPGNFSDIMIYQGASEEAVRAFEESWGLNDALYVQYGQYMMNLLTLDFGTSLEYRIPVWEYVQMKIFNSFILVGPGITAAYVIGTIAGTILGSKNDSKWGRYGIIPVIVVGMIPIFFTGILLIILFANWLGWFPTSGMLSPDILFKYGDAGWWRPYLTANFGLHYILPFTAILIRYTVVPTLVMRTSVTEVMGQGFSYYHRITGLSKSDRYKQLGKHAILPVITIYPISMTRAIGGLVLLEVVFNWPGIGLALIEAVLSRDFPVVQFVFFLVAAFVILGNFIVDILYGIIDPRISLGE